MPGGTLSLSANGSTTGLESFLGIGPGSVVARAVERSGSRRGPPDARAPHRLRRGDASALSGNPKPTRSRSSRADDREWAGVPLDVRPQDRRLRPQRPAAPTYPADTLWQSAFDDSKLRRDCKQRRMANGTELVIWTATVTTISGGAITEKRSHQEFRFREMHRTANNGSMDNGTHLVVWDCSGHPDQLAGQQLRFGRQSGTVLNSSARTRASGSPTMGAWITGRASSYGTAPGISISTGICPSDHGFQRRYGRRSGGTPLFRSHDDPRQVRRHVRVRRGIPIVTRQRRGGSLLDCHEHDDQLCSHGRGLSSKAAFPANAWSFPTTAARRADAVRGRGLHGPCGPGVGTLRLRTNRNHFSPTVCISRAASGNGTPIVVQPCKRRSRANVVPRGEVSERPMPRTRRFLSVATSRLTCVTPIHIGFESDAR